MIDIGEIIGWKFDHQQGMTTINGVIVEFPADVPGVNYDKGGLPTEEDQDAWILEYEDHIAATQYIKDREAAMHLLLPESVYIPAMLGQAKADRDGGKTLMPDLEDAVNIYDRILRDNPEP